MPFPPILLPAANFSCVTTVFTRPSWRPARWRTWNNWEKKILLSWVCFTKPTTWRVEIQIVRHCKWCFRKGEKKCILVYYCHWDGATPLPQTWYRNSALMDASRMQKSGKKVWWVIKNLCKKPCSAFQTLSIYHPMVFTKRECQKEVKCFTIQWRWWHILVSKTQHTQTSSSRDSASIVHFSSSRRQYCPWQYCPWQ